MNYLIGGSINSGKLEFVNELIKEGKVNPEDVFQGDILRRELYDSLNEEEKETLFPRMHRIFSKGEKGINIIQETGVEKYLEIERAESRVVYERKIKPLIDSMSENTKRVIVGVQLLPDFIEPEVKNNPNLKSIFLIRDNVEDILRREEEYAQESQNQRSYINSLSANTIQNGEASNQYLLHALAKAKYGEMIKKELEKLGLNSIVINTTTDFNSRILGLVGKL